VNACYYCRRPRFVKFTLSFKISVHRQHRRHSYLDRAARRREFTDEDLAELLTYEELVRLRVPIPDPTPIPDPVPIPESAPVTMAARIIPAVSCPLPTFSGSKKEDLLMFIEAIEIAHEEKRALYDTDEIALRAKKSLLMQACKSKAARYIKGLDQDKKDTWAHLVAALTEKYNAPNAEDRAKAYSKAMKLKQKSDEELGTYAKRAKKLAKRIDPALDRVLATHFTHGIRSRRLREMVVATSQNKADFTFKEVYESVRAIARSRRGESGSDSDSDSDSDSSSSSSTDSSAGGGSRHHHHRREEVRKAKEPKVTEVVEVKRPNPAPTPFNMDDLTKLIDEAARKLAGSYGMAPNPTHILGQPPQAPLIESYAVSSQSRPPFSGRSYQYGGQQSGGFQQQQSGGFQQQQSGGFQQQQPGGQGGYQQPSGQFGGPSQYPRSSITCYNCEERGHGYQQCPKPPQPDEARRAIYDRVNADRNWNYSTGQQQQRYQPPYRRSTDNARPSFMEPYSPQDVRSSSQPPVTTPQNPRISETNFVEEMACSSALDGVTVANMDFTDVSMIEEIFAVEKRKAVLSGPDSDGSDSRIAKKVAQDAQQTQFAVRGNAEARVSASGGGPSVIRESGGPSVIRESGGPSVIRESGGPSVIREPVSGAGPTAHRESAGPSTSILERPRAVAYSKTVERPVEKSGASGQTKIMRKLPEPAGVIRMMVGKPEFDFVSSLRDTAVAGMTWGDLFVLAPRVKRDVARQLVQERKASSKGKGKQRARKSVSFVEEAIDCHQVEVARPTAMGIGRALPEDSSAVSNFYTVGCINVVPCQTGQDITVYSIAKILVDSGSVLNLMPEYFARHLGFHLSPTKSLMMRTAAAEVSVIQWYVDVDIEIAGVISTSRVYCVPAPARPSYTLLLGRKWMKQVRAIGNYETGTYIIRDSLGKEYTVTAQAAPASVRAEVPVLSMCQEISDDDDDLDEETRLELALGPEGYADALLRQVEEEAELEMQTQIGAEEDGYADEDGYAGDSEESDDEVYVNEAGNASRH
jgi:hypothetical protein